MKLHLRQLIPGNFPAERQVYESLLAFQNASIIVTETSAKIRTKSNELYSFNLEQIQNDDFGRIYSTALPNGTNIRVVRPTNLAMKDIQTQGKYEFLNFGSTNLIGFSVKFHLVPEDTPDKLDYMVGPKLESEM
jgi:hypothetical protein